MTLDKLNLEVNLSFYIVYPLHNFFSPKQKTCVKYLELHNLIQTFAWAWPEKGGHIPQSSVHLITTSCLAVFYNTITIY